MEDKSWDGMENNTTHNPFIELDEHQAPTTHLPRLQVQNESSSSSHSDSSSQSDSDSDHRHQKIKILSDIYDQDVVQFAFFLISAYLFWWTCKAKRMGRCNE